MPDEREGRARNPTPPDPGITPPEGQGLAADSCDVCGSERLVWRNCKLLCAHCRSIVKSCADL